MKKPERPKVPRNSLPLMTPRNLVPATPMRFNSNDNNNDNSSGITSDNLDKKTVTKVSQRVGKDKSTPLPPGYVDRSAQRRSGALESDLSDIFDLDTKKTNNSTISESRDDKFKFLEESDSFEFPTCKTVEIERLMKFVLEGHVDEKANETFRPNEAFLQFKSIEEARSQPFDPFHRPRKVFRAASSRSSLNRIEEDSEVIEKVREAIKRLENLNEKNQKYLNTLASVSKNKSENANNTDDIFPEVGRFNEENSVEQRYSREDDSSVKAKAKSRLFGMKKQQQQSYAKEAEVDIFDLIAQKSLEDESKKEEINAESGGLFGFSDILPKLSRFEDENCDKKGSKLTGAYAALLSEDDDEMIGEGFNSKPIEADLAGGDDDEYLYPGHLENNSNNFDSDEEDVTTTENVNRSKAGGGGANINKRRLARREDKNAAKVEKLVKSKFGVDLTK